MLPWVLVVLVQAIQPMGRMVGIVHSAQPRQLAVGVEAPMAQMQDPTVAREAVAAKVEHLLEQEHPAKGTTAALLPPITVGAEVDTPPQVQVLLEAQGIFTVARITVREVVERMAVQPAPRVREWVVAAAVLAEMRQPIPVRAEVAAVQVPAVVAMAPRELLSCPGSHQQTCKHLLRVEALRFHRLLQVCAFLLSLEEAGEELVVVAAVAALSKTPITA